ncbi:hypothetical protein ACLBWH_08450 [Sphingomonas sp. M6A6_1c]
MQGSGTKQVAGRRRARGAGAMATRVAGVIGAVAASCAALSGAAQALPGTTAADGVARSPLQPLALGSGVEHDSRLTANLRLRVTTVATASGPREKTHQRLGSSMVEFYPVGASGFHLSAGTRMYDPRAGEQSTGRGLIGAPRQPNVPGGRAGLRRTPALTLGYAGALADRTRIGVEIGAMKGSAYANATDATRRLRGERGAGNPVNPMVHLVVGRRF